MYNKHNIAYMLCISFYMWLEVWQCIISTILQMYVVYKFLYVARSLAEYYKHNITNILGFVSMCG